MIKFGVSSSIFRPFPFLFGFEFFLETWNDPNLDPNSSSTEEVGGEDEDEDEELMVGERERSLKVVHALDCIVICLLQC